jgi:hypothetical protein
MSTARRVTSRVETSVFGVADDAPEPVGAGRTDGGREESVVVRATGFPAETTVFGRGAVTGCE